MEKVCVQWKNSHEQFKSSLIEMRRNSDFCDVTLVCDDGDVRAHRLVLSAGSNVFSKMLKSTNAANKSENKVQLKGIKKRELKWILDYIYDGQSVLDQSELESFLKKGNLLGLVGFQQDILSTNSIQIQEIIPRKSIENIHDLASETPLIDTEYKNETIPGETNQMFIKYNKKEINKQEEKPSLHKAHDVVLVSKEQSGEKLPTTFYNQSSLYTEDHRKIFDNQDCRDWTILDVLIRNSVTKKSEGLFLCNFCKEEFIYTNLLRVHMEVYFNGFPDKYKPAMVKIQGGKNWKCLECGKVSPKGHIREHIELHVPGLQYDCPDCSASFKSKNTMRTHMLRTCPNKEPIAQYHRKEPLAQYHRKSRASGDSNF